MFLGKAETAYVTVNSLLHAVGQTGRPVRPVDSRQLLLLLWLLRIRGYRNTTTTGRPYRTGCLYRSQYKCLIQYINNHERAKDPEERRGKLLV